VLKTAEELKRQQEREAEERAKFIASRVPQLAVDGLDKGRLMCQITYSFFGCF
jgi:Troponin